MQKLLKAIAAIMLSMMVFFSAGCGPEDDPINGGGGSSPTSEGIYLGIIGFNYKLFPMEIGLLNSSTQKKYTDFIGNLTTDNLTGLYYADYTALKKLKAYGQPPKLTNVALVTFTDGLDNASLDDDRNPENYPTKEAYLNALHDIIKKDKVHGLEINAYTIGLKGNDVQDVTAFTNNLKKLASDDGNYYEATSMDQVNQKFKAIAESLHTTTTTSSLSLLVPPGYDDGYVLRFTFDQVSAAESSTLYIECTYRRTNDGRRLENISYHGFKAGATSLSSVEKLDNGFYKFVFENLKKDNDSFVTQVDKNRLKLYRQITSGWEPETEFDNDAQSSVIEEQSSALIILVLDCTTSLGSQFSSLQEGAKSFVNTLVSSNNSGGGTGGGGNGGGTTQSSAKDILSFKFTNPSVTATIGSDHKISATVPAGTNVTNLVPSITVSPKATVSPASGVAQNFTNPVTYTVTAENGSKAQYVVTVKVQSQEASLVGVWGARRIDTYNVDYSGNIIPGSLYTYNYTPGDHSDIGMDLVFRANGTGESRYWDSGELLDADQFTYVYLKDTHILRVTNSYGEVQEMNVSQLTGTDFVYVYVDNDYLEAEKGYFTKLSDTPAKSSSDVSTISEKPKTNGLFLRR